MNKKYKVSVAVTAHNTSRFLPDCILSILSQSHKNWEIIFIDDGSKDSTIERMKELTIKNRIEDKVSMFRHEKNYGYGAALFHAIECGTGELVAIVDSDDGLSNPIAFEIMVSEHIKNPTASLIYSDYEECREDLKPYKKVKCTELKPGQTALGDFRGNSYVGNNVTISHLKVFKRDFYEKTGKLNYNLKKAVDKDLVLKLEEVGKLIHVPHFLYYHRLHNTSISSSFRDKPKEYIQEIMKAKTQMYHDARNRRAQNLSI